MQTQIITFPRSGHHFLIGMLADYCKKKYPGASRERFQTLPMLTNAHSFFHIGNVSYCEFYSCCKKVPCPHNVTIQKNHDFNLALPVGDMSQRRIVQFRNPIYSLISFYELTKGNFDKDITWENFAQNNSMFWVRWMEKWVLPQHDNTMYVSYEQLVINTSYVFGKILEFLGIDIDDGLLTYNSKIKRLDTGKYDTSTIEKISADTYIKGIQCLTLEPKC